MNILRNRFNNGWAAPSHVCVFLMLAVSVVGGCETVRQKAPPYPESTTARMHYELGNKFLNTGDYVQAADQFRQSIKIEDGAFLPYARLATAYYGQQKYLDAATAFSRATEVSGGPRNAGPFPILQALSLMRGGQVQEAEALLKRWSGPDVVVDATGSYYAGAGTLPGIWKTAARYVLGEVSEADYLAEAPQDDLSFPYLIIGIRDVIDEKGPKARESLSKVVSVAPGGTWRVALARAELSLFS